jgi:hypothetical protein
LAEIGAKLDILSCRYASGGVDYARKKFYFKTLASGVSKMKSKN